MGSGRSWSSTRTLVVPDRKIPRAGRDSPLATRRQADGRLLQSAAQSGCRRITTRAWTPLARICQKISNVCCLWVGTDRNRVHFWRAGKMSKVKRPFEGVIPNLERLYARAKASLPGIALRPSNPTVLRRLQRRRLKPEILAVRLGDQEEAARFRANGSGEAKPALPGLVAHGCMRLVGRPGGRVFRRAQADR